jgi:YggT family protein
MLLKNVYPIVWLIFWGAFLAFFALLILRLIFNYSDPNPFGTIGRFGFKIRKITERFVYPAARFLAMYRVDSRLAPLLTILIALVLTYFATQIIEGTFFVIDGLTFAATIGNSKAFIGFVLYGLLSVLVLFIFIRFLAQWFVFTQKTFFGFVMRVTNPIMIPFQKIIPRIGMFDISAMIVLILISLLQQFVLRAFVG